MKSTGKGTQKSAKRSASPGKKAHGFTPEERAAMKERVRELNAGEEDGESAVLTKIAAFPEPDRTLGKRIHAIVRSAAPNLTPRLWYGMPAYSKDGHVLCFFQNAAKFKARYQTLGFSDEANLDDGKFWPVVFAFTELTAADEARIEALVKKAVG